MDYTVLTTELAKFLIGGILGTLLTSWYKDLRSKRNERKTLFLRLVSAKGYLKLPQHVIDDVNMIELLFRSNKKVIEKYRLYYEELCQDKPNFEKQVACYWDLLRVMGDCVGYANVDNKTLRAGYTPNSSLREHNFQEQYQEVLIPFLKKMTESAEEAIPLHKLLVEYYENLPPKDEGKADETKEPQQ